VQDPPCLRPPPRRRAASPGTGCTAYSSSQARPCQPIAVRTAAASEPQLVLPRPLARYRSAATFRGRWRVVVLLLVAVRRIAVPIVIRSLHWKIVPFCYPWLWSHAGCTRFGFVCTGKCRCFVHRFATSTTSVPVSKLQCPGCILQYNAESFEFFQNSSHDSSSKIKMACS
jgi:hypothetical protein